MMIALNPTVGQGHKLFVPCVSKNHAETELFDQFCRTILTNARSQGSQELILMLGESGAGKSFTCNNVIRHLSTDSTGAPEGIYDEVRRNDRICEAFGNAATMMNANSSRFGRLFRFAFDKETGAVSTVRLMVFGWERSRVMVPREEESNFHILVAYAIHISDRGHRDGVTRWRILGTWEKAHAAVRDWGAIRQDLAARFDAREIKGFEALLEGVLALGNVVTGSDTSATNETRSCLLRVACLWGCSEDALRALLVKSSTSDGTKIEIRADVRELLGSLVYQRMWAVLVKRNNEYLLKLTPGAMGQHSSKSHQQGGVQIVDSPGSEHVDINLLDHLSMNSIDEFLHATLLDNYSSAGESRTRTANNVANSFITDEDADDEDNNNDDQSEQMEGRVTSRARAVFIALLQSIGRATGVQQDMRKDVELLTEHLTGLLADNPDVLNLDVEVQSDGRERQSPQLRVQHYGSTVAYQLGQFLEHNGPLRNQRLSHILGHLDTLKVLEGHVDASIKSQTQNTIDTIEAIVGLGHLAERVNVIRCLRISPISVAISDTAQGDILTDNRDYISQQVARGHILPAIRALQLSWDKVLPMTVFLARYAALLHTAPGPIPNVDARDASAAGIEWDEDKARISRLLETMAQRHTALLGQGSYAVRHDTVCLQSATHKMLERELLLRDSTTNAGDVDVDNLPPVWTASTPSTIMENPSSDDDDWANHDGERSFAHIRHTTGLQLELANESKKKGELAQQLSELQLELGTESKKNGELAQQVLDLSAQQVGDREEIGQLTSELATALSARREMLDRIETLTAQTEAKSVEILGKDAEIASMSDQITKYGESANEHIRQMQDLSHKFDQCASLRQEDRAKSKELGKRLQDQERYKLDILLDLLGQFSYYAGMKPLPDDKLPTTILNLAKCLHDNLGSLTYRRDIAAEMVWDRLYGFSTLDRHQLVNRVIPLLAVIEVWSKRRLEAQSPNIDFASLEKSYPETIEKRLLIELLATTDKHGMALRIEPVDCKLREIITAASLLEQPSAVCRAPIRQWVQHLVDRYRDVLGIQAMSSSQRSKTSTGSSKTTDGLPIYGEGSGTDLLNASYHITT